MHLDQSLPPRLLESIESGRWQEVARPENVWSLVDESRVSRVFPGESRIDFTSPPFHTVADEQPHADDFWAEFGALTEIEPDRALIIGDFGLGSDSVIVLDFGLSHEDPPVRWLQWNVGGNHWMEAAPDFDSFADALQLP